MTLTLEQAIKSCAHPTQASDVKAKYLLTANDRERRWTRRRRRRSMNELVLRENQFLYLTTADTITDGKPSQSAHEEGNTHSACVLYDLDGISGSALVNAH